MTDAIVAVISCRALLLLGLLLVRLVEQVQTRLIRSGTAYLSQEDMRQHFGLGEAKKADSVEVLWPDGTTSVKKNVEANRQLVIRQE